MSNTEQKTKLTVEQTNAKIRELLEQQSELKQAKNDSNAGYRDSIKDIQKQIDELLEEDNKKDKE